MLDVQQAHDFRDFKRQRILKVRFEHFMVPITGLASDTITEVSIKMLRATNGKNIYAACGVRPVSLPNHVFLFCRVASPLYASVNSKHQHPPGNPRVSYLLSAQLPGFIRSQLPGGCPGVKPNICYHKLRVDAAWGHFSASN